MPGESRVMHFMQCVGVPHANEYAIQFFSMRFKCRQWLRCWFLWLMQHEGCRKRVLLLLLFIVDEKPIPLLQLWQQCSLQLVWGSQLIRVYCWKKAAKITYTQSSAGLLQFSTRFVWCVFFRRLIVRANDNKEPSTRPLKGNHRLKCVARENPHLISLTFQQCAWMWLWIWEVDVSLFVEIAFKLADAFYHFRSKSETEESFERFSVWNTFKLRNLKYVYPSTKFINILNEALLSLSSQHANKGLQLLLIGNPIFQAVIDFQAIIENNCDPIEIDWPFSVVMPPLLLIILAREKGKGNSKVSLAVLSLISLYTLFLLKMFSISLFYRHITLNGLLQIGGIHDPCIHVSVSWQTQTNR